jgi:hypothetical protein
LETALVGQKTLPQILINPYDDDIKELTPALSSGKSFLRPERLLTRIPMATYDAAKGMDPSA